jgi:dTDP-glucose pyrophosphorylase
MTDVVILAAGRGTRMRRPASGATLTESQRRMAEQGLKALIPIHGRPYLDFVISAAADAGARRVCLVVGPATTAIRAHYEAVATERVRIEFAVQDEPLGSAHALLAAEGCVGADPFLVLNSDNFYPSPVLAAMRQMEGSGMAGFRRESLVAGGGIPAGRVAAYALATADADGCLDTIVEKPDADAMRELEGRSWISMTCWRFDPSIFTACRAIDRSSRGEFELPDAVLHARRELGTCFRILPTDQPVLDLSSQDDVPRVAERLAGTGVRL